MSTNSYWQRITTKILKLKKLLAKRLKDIFFFMKSKKEGIVSFCKKYYLSLTYLLSLFWTIIFGCLLFFGIFTINPDTIDDLLSTIWEGLVATLAIVFSIVLVAGQLASGYSPRMLGQVFKRTTIAYMLLFIFSALLPVVVLASGEMSLGLTRQTLASISLTLTVACLSFLIPYFLSLKEWLKPEKLLTDLKRGGEKSLEQTWKKELPKEVYGIRDLVMGSYQFKHYDIFDAGIEALRDMAIFATRFSPSKRAKKTEEAAEKIVDMLGDIGCLVAADRLAGVKIGEALGGIGGKWAAENLSKAKKVLEKLSEIGETSLEKKCDKTAIQVVYATHSVGKIAMDSDLPGVRKQAITRLRRTFLKTVEDMPNVAGVAAYGLEGLGNRALERKFDSEARGVLSALIVVAHKNMGLNRERGVQLALGSLGRLGRKAAESELESSTKSAIYILEQVACKTVDINEDWTGQAIFALRTVVSKAAERPILLSVAKEGVSFLREVGEVCWPNHPSAVSYIAKQLWILGAESPSEELPPYVAGQLRNLKNKVGGGPINAAYRGSQKWVHNQNKPELKRKLRNLKTQMEYFERTSSDEYEEFYFPGEN